jgi:hypothetical protein
MKRSELQALLREECNPNIVLATVGSCWECSSHSRNGGYYFIYEFSSKKKVLLHRLAYKLVKGKIPKGHVIRHRCDNRGCLKPSHLISGTVGDNNRDMVERGRQARGERNRHARLTEAQAREIKYSKESNKVLRERFNVHRNLVTGIRNGTYWKHI